MHVRGDKISEHLCAAASCLSAPSVCLCSPSISRCSFSDIEFQNSFSLMRGL